MKKQWLFCLVLLFSLTGCIGAKDYSCKGVPDGAMCLSVRETYQATHNEDYKHYNTNTSKTDQEIPPSKALLQNQRITVPEQAVRSLDGSHAVPVRIPAQIMRVWYGPYEGSHGQASFMPGVAYIELAARKWVFTKPNNTSGRKIQPLKVNSSVSTRYGSDPVATGLNDLTPQLPSHQKGKPTTRSKEK